MLSMVITLGYPALAAAVLIGAAGVPLPLSAALAVAGALARQGRLNLAVVFVVCTLAAVAGDHLGYVIGRFALRRLPVTVRGLAWVARVKPLSSDRPGTQRLAMVIFLTRWAFTAPASLLNVFAGAEQYSWRRFLGADLLGEGLWSALALAPGFALGTFGYLAMPLSLTLGALLGVGGLLLSRHHSSLGLELPESIEPETA
jgi:membrane-associated protein